MSPAFHPAGVHEHVRALHARARGGMRQTAEPAVMRAGPCGGLRGFAQRGVERGSDVIDVDALVSTQQPRGFKQGLWPFFVSQVAHHHRPQVGGGFDQRLAARARLEHHATLATQRFGQRQRSLLLQHDEPVRQRQRTLGIGVESDVPIKVGSGQRQHQRAIGMRARPRGHRGRRAAGVQGQQQIALIPLRPRPRHPHPIMA